MESKKSISTNIVESKTGEILEKLAPEFGISVHKASEMVPALVNGMLQYKSINRIAVIKVAEAVAPQLPMLGEKLYDSLKICSEEERARIIKFMIGAGTLTALGICGADVIKYFKLQNERTQRVEIVCDVIKNFSPVGMMERLADVIGKICNAK